MTGHQVLTMLVTGTFDRIAEFTNAAEEVAWAERVRPGTNPVGFTLWHCVRTADWAVQCGIRGVDEVAARAEWSGRWPAAALFGAGVSETVALEIAQRVGPAEVAAYNEAVRAESLGWLATLDDATLDTKFDFRGNQERAGYLQSAAWPEIADLDGLSLGQFLLRPAMGHVRVHIGEVGLLLQLARQSSEKAPTASQ
jgi:DinB family protein